MEKKINRLVWGLTLITITFLPLAGCGQTSGNKTEAPASLFLALTTSSSADRNHLLDKISNSWTDAYATMALETIYLSQDIFISRQLISLLQEKTDKKFGHDFEAWYEWLWNKPANTTGDYTEFKAGLYKSIDPKFEKYFRGRKDQLRIRLDEVRWGGVLQDGIPPLRNPKMIAASEADYLQNSNIVFGIEVNGDVRAYPKRILAWHEMFVDEVGGVPVVGVYCTLCGTVILYKTQLNGKKYNMGTSGFLYRSNKLMYDQATQSLWNTLQGEPVIGPLVDKGIALEYLSVVTTTWGEWKERHPDTSVLSINTGYNRNYGEGVAYNEYFSTDELMFNTPFNDQRLKNKDEILALRLIEYPGKELAIAVKFLNKNPIYRDKIGDKEFVVFTDKSGANRVYETKGVEFKSYNGKSEITDAEGRKWMLEESALKADDGQLLSRLPYHRAFWFGWYAAYPKTRLVK